MLNVFSVQFEQAMIFVDRRSDGSVCGIIIICGGDGVGVGGVTSIAVVVIIHRCSVLVAVAVVVLANDGRCGGGGGEAARAMIDGTYTQTGDVDGIFIAIYESHTHAGRGTR